MNTVSTFPQRVREIEHLEVPMPDGCRLAARVWLPEGAEAAPVPAVLEYIPYRKNDVTARRDAGMHPYIAGHGYAVVRLDLRGAGDSEGVMLDEYLLQELQDGADAIRWIAEQPWCDGKVGMIGISWGGFNGLQVAALRPPALKAVITCCSTDDRYDDDVHYMGGCLLIDQLSWASEMFWRNSLPPDPRHCGERWRSMWQERLTGSGLWLKNWLAHQSRDEFWKHGSICEDWSAVQVPVYAVSGWADGYCRSVFRLMQNLPGPRKGLIGPWAHKYPHLGVPGPAIGFLQECLRWWDHWLKGRDTGIMDEPMLRLFMQDPAPPKGGYAVRSGRWIAEPAWPSPNVMRTPFRLGLDGRLTAEREPAAGTLSHRSPAVVGMGAGKWCSYGQTGDQPVDQRADDAGSLCFETPPLAEVLEIAGDCNLDLVVSSDRPAAQLAARLVDVAPDGAATRVAYGVLNLVFRNGYETAEPLVPGERYRVRVPFKPIAQRFEKGHRIRLAVSTSYFPLIWPAPEPATVTLSLRESVLELPVRAPHPADANLSTFAAPESAPGPETETIAEPDIYWRVVQDVGADRTEMQVGDGLGTLRFPFHDLTLHCQGHERYSVDDDNLATATGTTEWEAGLSRGAWRVRTSTWTRLTADARSFRVEARLRAWEGDRLVHETAWDERVPRADGSFAK